MNILLLGIQNRIFLVDLRRELLKAGHQTDLLDLQEGFLIDSAGQRISLGGSPGTKNFLKKNFVLLRNFRKAKAYLKSNQKKYDVCNIHFLDVRYYFFRHFISAIAQRLIITTYGTDFNHYRKYRFLQLPLYRKASRITFANEHLKDRFNKFYHQEFGDKLHLCRFGLSTIDALRNNPPNADEIMAFREKYGIPANKIRLTIGYNSNPIHQQEQAIAEITKLDPSLQKQLFLILPLTYGGFDDHIKKIKNQLDQSTLSYVQLTSFLSEVEMQCLRLSSDIMINILKYDQLSATLCEYLYTGNYVITGAWLPYEPFDRLGIAYARIAEIGQLPAELSKIVENITDYKEKAKVNPEKIRNFSTWENNLNDWLLAYTA